MHKLSKFYCFSVEQFIRTVSSKKKGVEAISWTIHMQMERLLGPFKPFSELHKSIPDGVSVYGDL